MSEGFNCSLYHRVTSNGFWTGENPLEFALPLFILQLSVVVGTGRILELLLRPLKQPRLIAEILAGMLLGPTCVGTLVPEFTEKVFPKVGTGLFETFCSIGLLYWLFVVGIQLDVIPLLRSVGRKSVVISLAGIIPPFLAALATYFVIQSSVGEPIPEGGIIVFLGGIVVSVGSFPILAQFITEHKLVHTDVGMLALSGTVVNDIIMWAMIVIAGVLTSNNTSNFAALWVVLSGIVFVLAMVYIVRPAIWWIIRTTPEGEAVNELYVCLILVGVMGSGLVADTLGLRPAFGGLMFGLIIPDGPLGTTLIEKVEDFISGLLLPLFFAITGLRTNLLQISLDQWVLMVVLAVAQLVKIGGTLLVGLYYGLHLADGVLLSLLTNAKGVVDVILLNRLLGTKIISSQSFSIMVAMSVLMTMMVSPSISLLRRRAAPVIPYKHRTVQRAKVESELRILACVHSLQTVPTLINLLEASSTSKRSPLAVFALRLAELTDRASMLIVHDLRAKMDSRHNRPKPQHDDDRIIAAFEDFQDASGVQVQALTSISPYSTMHEDICTVAEEKRIALVLLPFHKLPTSLTHNEVATTAIRGVNQNVFNAAPCSVGVLIDRGLSGTTGISSIHISHQIAVLFFGGPDDREALCYAARMAEHEGISLTLLRFIIGDRSKVPVASTLPANLHQQEESDQISTSMLHDDKEKETDKEFINDFRLRTVGDNSVMYDEVVVCDGDETVNAIRSIDRKHDLFIVGRNKWLWESPVASGLTDWTECPELGPIGDLLASPDFTSVSVLVVQQYSGEMLSEDAFTAQVQQFIGSTNKHAVGQPSILNGTTSFARPPMTAENHLTKRRESQ